MKNKWDERYGNSAYVYGTVANDFIREHYRVLPEGNVICLAAGEGRNAVFLAKKGYRVTAVDQSVEGLKKISQLANTNGVEVETVKADLADFQLKRDYYQGIVMVFAHLPSIVRQSLYPQFSRALKTSGVFIAEFYRPEQLERATGGPSDSDYLMNGDILRRELTGLTIDYLNECQRSVDEGIYHTGMAAVVQVIARKVD